MTDGSSHASASTTLIDHLTELRDRLIRSAFAIIIATGFALYFSEIIFDLVRSPIAAHLPEGGLVFTNPLDKFMGHIKVSLVSGIILACPIWLYQVWKFVSPGLYAHEKRYSILFVFTGVLLFVVGVSFAYFLVLPAAFKFLFSFGGTTDRPLITISEYLSFFSTMTLVFGCCFELPLILVILGLIGLISAKALREKRRFAIVGMAFVSAILTPPDVLSMLLLLVPLMVLYEISIIVVSIFEKKRSVPKESPPPGYV